MRDKSRTSQSTEMTIERRRRRFGVLAVMLCIGLSRDSCPVGKGIGGHMFEATDCAMFESYRTNEQDADAPPPSDLVLWGTVRPW